MLQVIKEPEFKKYNAQIVIRNYALIKAFGSSKRLGHQSVWVIKAT